MNNDIIISKNHEFELIDHTSNFANFIFKVKKYGEDLGKVITVRLYGGIAVPSGISLTREERNKLHMKAIYEYKKGYHF